MKREYREDFPLLQNRRENGRRLVYLDNAATTQKPVAVIQAIRSYYENSVANPHRGAYSLSEDATGLYEQAREKVAAFIGAGQPEEVVFTSGTTASLNTVALLYMPLLGPGDEIVLTISEHHSNLLPWQRLARLTGATLRYVYGDRQGLVPLKEWEQAITGRTKIVALHHISNVLGGILPVREVARLAHRHGAVVVLDAAQSVPHMRVSARALEVDFLAFSAHKMLGPAGIGVLYGKKNLLDSLEPAFLGGGMVEEVQEQSARYLEAPWKLEAGTPNVEGAVGLAAAIDYLNTVGWDTIQAIEARLTGYALERLRALPEVEVYGPQDAKDRAGILSFTVKDVHPHDVASILNSYGVAIRAGHHCAKPLMRHLGVQAACRASLYFYNTCEDVDRFVEALSHVREVLGYGA